MKITTRLSKRKNDIPKAVEEFAEARATSYCNFVSYLEKFDDEILQRTFGYKKPKNKKLLITEVTRRVSGCNKYITLDSIQLFWKKILISGTKKQFLDITKWDMK